MIEEKKKYTREDLEIIIMEATSKVNVEMLKDLESEAKKDGVEIPADVKTNIMTQNIAYGVYLRKILFKGEKE